MTGISNRIKSIRESQKLSQEYMADKLGITSRAYQNYEYGRTPTMKKLELIADILKVRVNDLLDEQKVPLKGKKSVIYTRETVSGPSVAINRRSGEDQLVVELKGRIASLEADNEYLRKQNEKLMSMLDNSLQKS